jgi:hypothetical protein
MVLSVVSSVSMQVSENTTINTMIGIQHHFGADTGVRSRINGMKKFFLCVWMIFCFVVGGISASTAFAQTSNRVSLQLGTVTVWLGMDKGAAKQQMEASGIYFPDSPDSNAQVIAMELQTKRLFTLKFENNKLVYADRNWLRDDSDVLPSVMDALTSLVDQGATKCTIEHAPMSSPDVRVNRVFIDCGERGILLTYGSTDLGSDRTISERIGRLR